MTLIGTEIWHVVLFVGVISLVYLAQRYWFRLAWGFTARIRSSRSRTLTRAIWVMALISVVLTPMGWALALRGSRSWSIVSGMWFFSTLLGYLGIRFVSLLEWLWNCLRRWTVRQTGLLAADSRLAAAAVDLSNPSRRYFFQTAAATLGTLPFGVAAYGYLRGRLQFRCERVEIPIAKLPAALDGLRIAQLSDTHIGAFLTREEVQRAVEMANEWGPELAVFTGDFITGPRDPLEACIEELAALRAPLGVWGCLGNHEIYAQCEDRAAEVCRQAGIHILRRQNAEVVRRGQALNLIGVDYQRTRAPGGRLLPLLTGVESLVRRDAPNILLSHNPNAFPRAAELGIELTLAGHTHGGQVQVEILHSRLNPARFVTPFIAGLYSRAVAESLDASGDGSSGELSALSTLPTRHSSRDTAFIYVNRGIGTVGAPVRFNSPPEITLITLRRA